jgi:CO/xanthine dehydrogenase FAD-binding subunit
MLTYDSYLIPRSLPEALMLLEGAEAQKTRLIAGGTDILPWARQGRAGDVHIPRLVDISELPELKGVRLENGLITVGAASPIEAFIEDGLLRRYAPVLSQCAVWFADDQIRAQATVGGNLINASPAGDSQPALLVHNCRVVLAQLRSDKLVTRSMPLSDFILGPGKHGAAPNEILVSLELDALEGFGSAFEKVGHRRSLVISTVCLAAVVKLDNSKKIEDIRISIGAVGPQPVRLPNIENALKGQIPTPALLRNAATKAADYVRSRSRQDYRREVLVNFVERGLSESLNQAGLSLTRLPKEA